MKTLKDYVCNRYRPEGCIAKSYIAEEALEFCAEYLSNCDIVGLPIGCLIDFSIKRPLRGANIKVVDDTLLAQVHRCVLMNTIEIQTYIDHFQHYRRYGSKRCVHLSRARRKTKEKKKKGLQKEEFSKALVEYNSYGVPVGKGRNDLRSYIGVISQWWFKNMSLPKPDIERFTIGGDFSLWRMKMRALFVHQGLESALEEDDLGDASSSVSDEKKRQIQNKAHSTLILSLSNSILREISEEKTALEHIDNFNKIILDLEGVENVKITDEDKAFFLLSSLPKIYEGFVDTMLYGRTTLTLEDVKASLSSKEIQKNNGHEVSNAEGLFARTEKKNQKKKNQSQAKKDDVSVKEKMKKRKCFYCKKQDHYIRDCAEKKRDEKERTGDAAVASEDSSDDGYHSADLLVASNSNIKGQWVLDSGCSFHLCPDKSLFHTYKSVDGGRVLMGNNNVCKIVGMGSVKIEMFDGSVQTLSDVRHAPRLKRNLISLGMLDGMGYSFKSENSGLKIMKGTEMVMKGVKKNGLYVLEGSSVPGSAAMPAVSDVNRTMLWHLRLGHMSIRGMQELSKQGLLCGDNIDELDFCENCIFGKAHRSKFTKGIHVSKQPLDYVHVDLWGPAQVPSLSGGRYFMSVIDDYSRKVWIHILKTKDQALEKFKIWKTLVETQSGFKEWGVRRHKTVRFTPQQNGLAERMNRTLIDKTRCLLINSKLPRSLWAEAVSTASYLVNKSPSSAIGFKTPEELWSGRPGKYEHLRVFGCPAYVHVRQGKLDARAIKGVFVGYPDRVKGYRVWCKEANKCLISRDVQFNEVAMINNSDQATSANDINTSDTQATIETEQGEKIEVELSKDYEDQIQPEAVEAETQDAEVTEGEVPQVTDLQQYQLARDRERRHTRPPARYAYADMVACALMSAEDVAIEEPNSYREAMSSKNSRNWIKAMREEIDSLVRNQTWILVPNPGNRKIVSCKWIFKKKEGIPGVEDSRYKARLVARGFTQKEGIDFNEIFSPVVKHSSIRILLAMVALFDLELEQMDVKTAFLHGNLEEKILMSQPEGFEEQGHEEYVCLLKRSLYGLKQSPRQWYRRFDQFMISNGYSRSKYDSCVYHRIINSGGAVYLLLYVDDILIAGKDLSDIKELKNLLKGEFEMKDLGSAKRILGIDIVRDRIAGTLFLSQSRADIAYAVSVVSRFMSNPGKLHWDAVKWVMRYLKGTLDHSLMYGKSKHEVCEVRGYVDSDFTGDLDRRKSISGYLFMLDSCLISWKATLQHIVALSSTEAEFVVAIEAVKESMWLRGLLNELWLKQKTVEIFCDNQSAIQLIKNQVYHERTKHIDVKLHFIRDEVAKGSVAVIKIHTDINPADMLTKVLPTTKFKFCVNFIGVGSSSSS
ncbi:hypothetical protein KPL71_023589 [Citrus sinensis]|uniref:Uncharacterized protein n=1 Tax=Citrus sinensis TaxID=2711 RepID=A0ACB8IJP7_CITSI|nr:hypothetical protein KPL71_023589 [Citrus sinensis]